MKVRVPEVSRAFCLFYPIRPPYYAIPINHTFRISSLGLRSVHSTPHTRRFSLADHIKQFIPPDAIETPESRNEEFYESVDIQHTSGPGSLAAYPAELELCQRLVGQLRLKEAAKQLEELPLNAYISALTNFLIPKLLESGLGEPGAVELVYQIFLRDNEALVAQILPELVEKFPFFENVSVLQSFSFLSRVPPSMETAQLDAFLSMYTDAHFPQILSHNDVSAWFRMRLLAQLNHGNFRKWLHRYRTSISSADITLLINTVPHTHLDAIGEWLLENKRDMHIICEAVNTPHTFQAVCRPFIKRKSVVLSTDNTEVPVALLSCALKLKLTYEVGNICSKFHVQLGSDNALPLLADALLAAAFAQRRPENQYDMNSLVSGTEEDFRTFLVAKVLEPALLSESYDSKENKSRSESGNGNESEEGNIMANKVVGYACSKLFKQYPKKVPGNVLWQLVLSLPAESMSIYGPAQRALARLVVQRPYVEQLRYMALPMLTARGVGDVLRWHIQRIMDVREVNVVPKLSLQAEEDIQFLVAGIIIATEKGASEGETSLMIRSLFASESKDKSDLNSPQLLESIIGESHAQQKPMSRNIIFSIVSRLIDHKSFVVAFQLLEAIGPAKVSSFTLDALLQALALEHPETTYKFLVWLLQEHKAAVSPKTVNKMLTLISNSSKLSESQLMNRFQSLRLLMGKTMRKHVDAEAAIALVDAFINSALQRGSGSRMRLKWALDIAQTAKVPEEKFDEWSKILNEMQESKQGYWYE